MSTFQDLSCQVSPISDLAFQTITLPGIKPYGRSAITKKDGRKEGRDRRGGTGGEEEQGKEKELLSPSLVLTSPSWSPQAGRHLVGFPPSEVLYTHHLQACFCNKGYAFCHQ